MEREPESRRRSFRPRALASLATALVCGLVAFGSARLRAQAQPGVRYEVQLEILEDRIDGFARLTFPTAAIPEGADRIAFDGEIRRFGWNGLERDLTRLTTEGGVLWPARNLAAEDDLNRAELWFTIELSRPTRGVVVTRDGRGAMTGLHSVQWPGYRSGLWPCLDDPRVPSRCELEVLAPADWLVRASTDEIDEGNQVRSGRDRTDGLISHRFEASSEGPLDAFGFVAGRLAEVATDPGRGVRVFGPPAAGASMSAFSRALGWLSETRLVFERSGFAPDPRLDVIWLPGCDEVAARTVGLYVVSDPLGHPPTRLDGMRAWLESIVRPPLPSADRGPWLGLREWICREALGPGGAGPSIRRDLYRAPSLALRWAAEWNAVRARTGQGRFLQGVRAWLVTRERQGDERELAKIIDATLPDPFRARTVIDWSPGGDPPDEVVVEATFAESGAKGTRARKLRVIEDEREVVLDVTQRGARSEIGRLRGRPAPLCVVPVQTLDPGLPVGLSATAWQRVADLPDDRLFALDLAEVWTTARASWSAGSIGIPDLTRFGARLIGSAPTEELDWLGRELVGLALASGEDGVRAQLAAAMDARVEADPTSGVPLAPLRQLVLSGSCAIPDGVADGETLRALGSTLDPSKRQQLWKALVADCSRRPWLIETVAARARTLSIPADRASIDTCLGTQPGIAGELAEILRLSRTAWSR